MKQFSWGQAFIAGVLATIAFDVAMYADIALTKNPANIPAMLGSKLLGESSFSTVVGHLGHFINGIALAIIFAALAPHMPGNNNITKAVVFSVVETIIGVWMLVLPLLGAGFAGIAAAGAILPIVTMTRHIAYGLVLGAVYNGVGSKQNASVQ